MEVLRSGQGESVEVVFDGGDFVISPGAARVLLRIMRKAAARALDEAGSGADAERIAS